MQLLQCCNVWLQKNTVCVQMQMSYHILFLVKSLVNIFVILALDIKNKIFFNVLWKFLDFYWWKVQILCIKWLVKMWKMQWFCFTYSVYTKLSFKKSKNICNSSVWIHPLRWGRKDESSCFEKSSYQHIALHVFLTRW